MTTGIFFRKELKKLKTTFSAFEAEQPWIEILKYNKKKIFKKNKRIY